MWSTESEALAEVDVFLALPFPMIHGRLAIWSLVPLPLWNLACISGSSWFRYCRSLAWRTFQHNLDSIWSKHNCMVANTTVLNILWHCPSWRLEWKLNFSSPVTTAGFSRFAGILSGASFFRIWKSYISNSITYTYTTLFIVMLPKAHLTSHSKMLGSRWMATPSQLFRSLRPFFHTFSVYSCYLFLISSASVRSLLLLSLILPILAWHIPFDISSFLEEISSLTHSIVFLYFFALFI